jgi:dienelactone hydrolase
MRSKKNLKTKNKKTESRPAHLSRIILVVAAVLFILVVAYFLDHSNSDKWSVSNEGVLSYPENRGKVDVAVLKTESGSNYTLETISFPSKDYTVDGLLRIPSSGKKVPAIVILPGATVPKEGTRGLAEILSGMGYASLGIQQRNLGGVDMEYDLQLFSQGKEPVEHIMVFDALRAIDVLRQDPRIDAKNITVIGESNGGRFAIIAAALDKDIKGVIGISTSGYDIESQSVNIRNNTILRFYRSIDPDTYLKFIPPRMFVMMHSVNDSIIQIGFAENTFKKAKEPKMFYKIGTGNHGFSEGMRGPLEIELKLMFQ